MCMRADTTIASRRIHEPARRSAQAGVAATAALQALQSEACAVSATAGAVNGLRPRRAGLEVAPGSESVPPTNPNWRAPGLLRKAGSRAAVRRRGSHTNPRIETDLAQRGYRRHALSHFLPTALATNKVSLLRIWGGCGSGAPARCTPSARRSRRSSLRRAPSPLGAGEAGPLELEQQFQRAARAISAARPPSIVSGRRGAGGGSRRAGSGRRRGLGRTRRVKCRRRP
jgi:hypothetical protein